LEFEDVWFIIAVLDVVPDSLSCPVDVEELPLLLVTRTGNIVGVTEELLESGTVDNELDGLVVCSSDLVFVSEECVDLLVVGPEDEAEVVDEGGSLVTPELGPGLDVGVGTLLVSPGVGVVGVGDCSVVVRVDVGAMVGLVRGTGHHKMD
jgi:hypothetical protein